MTGKDYRGNKLISYMVLTTNTVVEQIQRDVWKKIFVNA